jgi:hypothetical protein
MDWPKGEPCSSPGGASAGTRSWQQAARASPAEQAHLGHIRPDGRQFDALVDLLRGLPRCGEGRRAFWAGGLVGIDHPVGIRMQRTPLFLGGP